MLDLKFEALKEPVFAQTTTLLKPFPRSNTRTGFIVVPAHQFGGSIVSTVGDCANIAEAKRRSPPQRRRDAEGGILAKDEYR